MSPPIAVLAMVDTVSALKVRTAPARIETGNLGDVKPVGQGMSELCPSVGEGLRITS